MNRVRQHFILCAALPLLLSFPSLSAWGQENHTEGVVRVTVDAGKVRNYMAPRAMGMHTSVYDNSLSDPNLPELLRAAGVTTLRYPGGGYADIYHWSVHKSTKWRATDPPQYGYLAEKSDVGHFLRLVDKLRGTAIITVNYGSNLAGTGGGEPAEAAAWVAYSNGDPSDSKVIGKDSAGNDWKTVGYWASLRASGPLTADDGQNFLRIGHPAPFTILYWEIGNEIFGSGYYGGEGMEEDLHVPYGRDTKESEKLRQRNPKLSPEAYGKGVVEFARAMKAVDPRIKIGAVLDTVLAGDAWSEEWTQDAFTKQWAPHTRSAQTGNNSLDWNTKVMKEAGKNIDFVIVHWYTGNLLPPDWKVLDDASYLSAPQRELPAIMKGLLDLFQKYGGDNAGKIQLAVTEMGSRPNAKLNEPAINALFAADAYLSCMESGAANIDWLELHKDSFLNEKEEKPGPVFFALQMIHRLAHINASIVDAKSSHTLLPVHAALRGDGSLGIMLINLDSKNAVTVKVRISGASFAADGSRYDFDPKNPPDGYVTKGGPAGGLGNEFTIQIAPRTITDIMMPKAH